MRIHHLSRLIALVWLAAASSQLYASPFTTGDLAVLRYGDGVENLGTGNAVSAYIDEYSPSGTLVQTIPMPTSGISALTAVGTASRDGIIQLSQDGSSIVLGGYRANQGALDPIANNAA